MINKNFYNFFYKKKKSLFINEKGDLNSVI